MDSSLVSIIVPIYNTAEYVEDCIKSILSQTYKNIELILVNDGSIDGSGDVCKRYGHLPNVLYMEQGNCGVTIARERGLAAARGEWIMFVDSDDTIPDYAIERMMQKTNGTNIVLGSYQRNNLANEPDVIDRDDYLMRMYQRTISFSISPKLFRRSLFRSYSFDTSRPFVWGEDFLMNLQLAIDNAKPVHICQSQMYFYRPNPSSASHTFDHQLDYFAVFADAADRMMEGHLPVNALKKSSAMMRMHLFFSLLSHNNYHLNRNHPFVKKTIQCQKDAGLYSLGKRLLLNHPSRTMFRITARLEKPSLLKRDLKRFVCGELFGGFVFGL